MKYLLFILFFAASTLSFAQEDQDNLTRDNVVVDDQIVQGSECVGLDCVNGENFGFDTGRYKENNLRLHFDDTSASASFPGNDWRIVINDSSNGGLNHFSIEDATATTTPFRILAGAPNNSLFVNDVGNVGVGTGSPVLELQVTDGNTPAIRLEQDGTSGWTPQTWDVAGNEVNFFVRNVNNGSTLPFRIFPDAPSDMLVVKAAGVGIGTDSPTNTLEVMGDIGLTGTIYGVSDKRLKNNIESIDNANDIINALDGKSYTFKNELYPSMNLPQGDHYGLIAQDVEKVLENLVNTEHVKSMDQNGNEITFKGVNYNELIPILVNAVKEQNEIIDDLKSQQSETNNKIQKLEEIINAILEK